MDPLRIAAGSPGNCLLIDCQKEHYETVAWPSSNASIMVAHTGVSRNLNLGHYAQRRAECERAALAIGVSKLCEVQAHELPACEWRLDEIGRRRIRHVMSETKRVYDAADALRHSNWKELGRLMSVSHVSLRDDFDVSCPELNCIVEIAETLPGVWGSRMTGAGFGGCSVSLIESDKSERIAQQLPEKYFNQTGLRAQIWVFQPAGGASALSRET
jgi:galactokinase